MAEKKDILKYNELQKVLGAAPMDPEGSIAVTDATKMIVRLINEKNKNEDKEYIYGFVKYTLRPDGPYNELTKKEKTRTAKLVLDHYGIPFS